MQSLLHLSDEELVAHLMTCCFDMRRFKVNTLVFLAEIEERPMCGPHNLLLAEQALGREYIQRRIRFRQQKHGDKKDPADR
jgi:hypothetical protein